MQSQLQQVIDSYKRAQADLHALSARVSDDRWSARPPGRWSVADNVEHLNSTSRDFLPVMRAAVEQARALGSAISSRYRRDPMGWLLWKIMPPPVRVMRVKTSADYEPKGGMDRAALLARFDELQAEQIAVVASADGLPIDRVKIASPFDARASYNLYACFTILPAHQHRHIWQAEQALATLPSDRDPTARP